MLRDIDEEFSNLAARLNAGEIVPGLDDTGACRAAELLTELGRVMQQWQHLSDDDYHHVRDSYKKLAIGMRAPGTGLATGTAGQRPSALHHLAAKELGLSSWAMGQVQKAVNAEQPWLKPLKKRL